MFHTLKETLEREPDNVEALEKIWISIEVCRNYEESIALHLGLIDKKPYNSLAWYNLGHAYNFVGEYDRAIDALEYSFLIDPNFESGYLDCAEMCIQQQQYARAYEIYQEALERFGPNEEVIPTMIDALMHLNRKKEALHLALQFLEQDQYNDELLFYVAEIYREKGKHREALKYYDRAIYYNRSMETYHYGIAKTFEALGAFNNAEDAFKEAAYIAPEETLYWAEYAAFLIKRDKPFEAMAVLDEADNHTVGVELDYLRAACLYMTQREEEGFALLEEAVKEDASYADTFLRLHGRISSCHKMHAMIRYYSEG